MNRQKLSKKAFLFAWITLSSIPEEIFISPHILDFFEEALKPLPITVSANSPLTQEQRKMAGSTTSTNNNTDTPAQYVYYASFPVDVIVFFHFQPTIIRLGCLPVSRVECLLHLPSIDLVMSSKRSDFDFDMNMDTLSTPQSFQNLSTKAYKSFTKSVITIESFLKIQYLILIVLFFFFVELVLIGFSIKYCVFNRWWSQHNWLSSGLFTVHFPPLWRTEE